MRLLLAEAAPRRTVPCSLVEHALPRSCPVVKAAEEGEACAMMNRHRYPKQWRRLATECKDRAGWRCERCGIKHGTLRRSLYTDRIHPVWLQAHHVNGDPESEEPQLQALCPSCHFFYRRNPPAWLLERIKHQKLLARS